MSTSGTTVARARVEANFAVEALGDDRTIERLRQLFGRGWTIDRPGRSMILRSYPDVIIINGGTGEVRVQASSKRETAWMTTQVQVLLNDLGRALVAERLAAALWRTVTVGDEQPATLGRVLTVKFPEGLSGQITISGWGSLTIIGEGNHAAARAAIERLLDQLSVQGFDLRLERPIEQRPSHAGVAP